MKTLMLAAFLVLGCSGETVEGILLPSKCQNEDPKTHTRDCALACKDSGFGLRTGQDDFLAFDPAGNKKAIEMLEAGKKTTDLRVSVEGTRHGALIEVKAISWR